MTIKDNKPVFRISYALRGGERVRNKYFNDANSARLWFIEHKPEFTSYVIVELDYLNERQLFDRAFLQLECEQLGKV